MKNKISTDLIHGTIVAPALASATLLWLSQPPVQLWWLSFVAIVPLLLLIIRETSFKRKGYVKLWCVFALYWLISLQGLRHAHPLMYGPWLALGGYLAIYPTVFVLCSRFLYQRGMSLMVVAPLVWVALEYTRNHLLTGISVLMLGHSLMPVPILVQTADVFGSYGVGAFVVIVNLFAWQLLQYVRKRSCLRQFLTMSAFAVSVTGTVIIYGVYRMGQKTENGLATFALIQRNEAVEYVLDPDRQSEMFQNYVASSVDAARSTTETIDAYVWPESMYSETNPLILAETEPIPPKEFPGSPDAFKDNVNAARDYFNRRTVALQNKLQSEHRNSTTTPELIVGCGVVNYGKNVEAYSGVVHIGSDHQVDGWYGKTHLVMFGEYIPLVPSIPGLRSLVPPGMGLQQGDGGKLMDVRGTLVAPNVCIETAVERVTVNQMNAFLEQGRLPDVICTVTNDGWFDESSVIDHHLRCAQMVAVACRRPILSAANNGPTAWIDSCGRIAKRLETGTNGHLIASPARDSRISLAARLGDMPAAATLVICVALAICVRNRVPHTAQTPDAPDSESAESCESTAES